MFCHKFLIWNNLIILRKHCDSYRLIPDSPVTALSTDYTAPQREPKQQCSQEQTREYFHALKVGIP